MLALIAEKPVDVVLLASVSAGEPMAIEVTALLLVGLPSLAALVVPLTGVVPPEVGMPDTVHVTLPPAATVAGSDGEQVAVRPAGRVPAEHDATVAASAGEAAFEQVKVPV